MSLGVSRHERSGLSDPMSYAKRVLTPTEGKGFSDAPLWVVRYGCINVRPKTPSSPKPPREYPSLPESLKWLARDTRSKNSMISKKVREISLRVFGSFCFYCRGKVENFDHFVSHARGGRNSWRNIVPSCFSCNKQKADSLPTEEQIKLHKSVVDTYLLKHFSKYLQ